MSKRIFAAAAVAGFSIIGNTAEAQSADTIVVFDGSGSMWGQISGRTKVEIARETLSSVLSEVDGSMQIGMIAYGHRQKGICTDIETVVPVGNAMQSVPQMIAFANQMQPKGKTPLTDAVRKAAQELRYTENAATVVLVTDGIETCNADPCALGRELEAAGIGFTAHVVGFGLSEEEGQKVRCLADTTGGEYIQARDANGLAEALRQTVQAPVIEAENDDFGPSERKVRFILRDTPEGSQIGTRQLSGYLEGPDGERISEENFKFAYPEAQGASAHATLAPGKYTGHFLRENGRDAGFSVAFAFEVPDGEGEYTVEGVLSGALTIIPYINPKMRFEPGSKFPTAIGGSRRRMVFAVFPINDGAIPEEPVAKLNLDNLTVPLPAGRYLVQGNLDSQVSVEYAVDVGAGSATEVDFSFDATRVFIETQHAQGLPKKRQTTYWYDGVRKGRNYFISGGGAKDGEVQPFYLPTGRWQVNVGGEGTGKRRSEFLVDVPGDFADIQLTPGESLSLSEVDYAELAERTPLCVAMVKVGRSGCMLKRADLSAGKTPDQPELAPTPSSLPVPPATTEDALAGLNGPAFLFTAWEGEGEAAVVLDPSLAPDALIVLKTGWCGDESCAGRRVRVRLSDVENFTAKDYRSGNFAHKDFEFSYSIQGDDFKALTVTPNGQSVQIFRWINTIELGANTATNTAPQQGKDEAEKPANPSTSGVVTLKGVFGVYPYEGGLEELKSSYQIEQQCQSTPLIFYPDGAIEKKAFSPPPDPKYNPYKTVARGQCSAVGGQLVECIMRSTDDGRSETIRFAAQPLGDNDYKLNLEETTEPLYAVSCFYPGGPMQARQTMPNGKQLGQLLLQRHDGKDPGMGYDENNNRYDGKW